MEILLIRHGSTAWNAEGRYQGWRDIPLSNSGIVEAEQLGQRLKDQTCDIVACSDLTRCQDTARRVFPKAKLHLDPGLREYRFGDWEGLTYAECLTQYPQRFASWLENPASTTPPNGESLSEFEHRIFTALDALIDSWREVPSARIAVVTHGGPIRALLRRATNTDAASAYRTMIRPCGTALLSLLDGAWTVRAVDSH